jgi:hypothetical protein
MQLSETISASSRAASRTDQVQNANSCVPGWLARESPHTFGPGICSAVGNTCSLGTYRKQTPYFNFHLALLDRMFTIWG